MVFDTIYPSSTLGTSAIFKRGNILKWLINYIRQCFCKHEFEKEEIFFKHEGRHGAHIHDFKISLLCKKCGYHKSFWKYSK